MDTIVLDANVITAIGRGEKRVADGLNVYLKKGKVYIALVAYNELVFNISAPKGEQYDKLLKDIGIGIAPFGQMDARVSVLSDDLDQYRDPPTPATGNYIKLYTRGNPDRGLKPGEDVPKPSDAFIVAQVKAIKGAKLWSLDRIVYQRAGYYGVETIDECNKDWAGKGSGVGDPAVARKLLWLLAELSG